MWLGRPMGSVEGVDPDLNYFTPLGLRLEARGRGRRRGSGGGWLTILVFKH